VSGLGTWPAIFDLRFLDWLVVTHELLEWRAGIVPLSAEAVNGTVKSSRLDSMALAKRNEAANVSSDINVTPMVDVMLVLLIIFMVVTPMLQHGVPVDMAKVNNPTDMHDADKEDALLVAVTRDDKVFFGTDVVKPDDLTEKIKDKLANRTDKRVFLKADMRAKFGWVVEVVDDVRAAGVDQLGLLTDQKKAGTMAPPPGATTPTPAPTGGQ
jgi:biopolymer transport protein TolR